MRQQGGVGQRTSQAPEFVFELQTRPENLSSSQFIELYNAICKEEAQRDGRDGLSDTSTALLADSLP
jgi:hypothetical protein